LLTRALIVLVAGALEWFDDPRTRSIDLRTIDDGKSLDSFQAPHTGHEFSARSGHAREHTTSHFTAKINVCQPCKSSQIHIMITRHEVERSDGLRICLAHRRFSLRYIGMGLEMHHRNLPLVVAHALSTTFDRISMSRSHTSVQPYVAAHVSQQGFQVPMTG
jgi:hypothetical protein